MGMLYWNSDIIISRSLMLMKNRQWTCVINIKWLDFAICDTHICFFFYLSVAILLIFCCLSNSAEWIKHHHSEQSSIQIYWLKMQMWLHVLAIAVKIAAHNWFGLSTEVWTCVLPRVLQTPQDIQEQWKSICCPQHV